jgi:hypothetical protein
MAPGKYEETISKVERIPKIVVLNGSIENLDMESREKKRKKPLSIMKQKRNRKSGIDKKM